MRRLANVRSRVFFDSAAYCALAVRRDVYHARAEAIARQMLVGRARTYTTNFVVAEAYGLALIRGTRDDAVRILDRIDRSATIVVRVTEDDEQRAREIIRRYDDKDFSLIDAMSFVVMERLNISHAFTFDRHFAQYGFVMLDDATGV